MSNVACGMARRDVELVVGTPILTVSSSLLTYPHRSEIRSCLSNCAASISDSSRRTVWVPRKHLLSPYSSSSNVADDVRPSTLWVSELLPIASHQYHLLGRHGADCVGRPSGWSASMSALVSTDISKVVPISPSADRDGSAGADRAGGRAGLGVSVAFRSSRRALSRLSRPRKTAVSCPCESVCRLRSPRDAICTNAWQA